MVRILLLLALLLFPTMLSGQFLDPDTCWSCRDTREHALAGVGIDVTANVVLPKSKLWQRVLIVTTIGAAYELGQADGNAGTGRHTAGYGFGLKDLTADIAGALLAELLLTLARKAI